MERSENNVFYLLQCTHKPAYEIEVVPLELYNFVCKQDTLSYLINHYFCLYILKHNCVLGLIFMHLCRNIMILYLKLSTYIITTNCIIIDSQIYITANISFMIKLLQDYCLLFMLLYYCILFLVQVVVKFQKGFMPTCSKRYQGVSKL